MGHSLGAHIGVRFATLHPERVAKLVLFDGGLDVRAEILDALAPAINRLGVEFPSLEKFLATLQDLPMFAGRWNDYLARHTPTTSSRARAAASARRWRVTQSRRRWRTSSARASGSGTTNSRPPPSSSARRTASCAPTTVS